MNANSDRARQRFIVLGLHLIALAVLALQAYVRRFPPTPTALPEPDTPEALWWGLWPITYLPTSAFVLGGALVIGGIALYWFREFTSDAQPRSVERHSPHVWAVLLLISGLLAISFFAFPIVHTRWGDSYIIARTIAWSSADFRLTHTWQAPLDVFLHSQAWRLLHPYVDWKDAAPLYRILSPIAGMLYLGALLVLSRNRRFAPGWLSFGLLITLGVIQLFFGYVENYSFAAAMTLVYLWLGVQYAQDRRSLWLVATALALANSFHPSTLVLGPSLLALAWLFARSEIRRGNKPLSDIVIRIGMQVVAPMAIVYGLTWLMMESGNHGIIKLFTTDRPGGGDARWLVPLFETTTEWERYTMFSWPHLRDFLNEQLLVAPVALPSILFISIARRIKRQNGAHIQLTPASSALYAAPDQPVARFLLIAFLGYLLLTWVWNPDYGGQRDWDLFSLVAIPEAMLLVYMLTRTLAPVRYLAMGAAPLIAVQALHTVAWIYQNTLPWSWP